MLLQCYCIRSKWYPVQIQHVIMYPCIVHHQQNSSVVDTLYGHLPSRTDKSASRNWRSCGCGPTSHFSRQTSTRLYRGHDYWGAETCSNHAFRSAKVYYVRYDDWRKRHKNDTVVFFNQFSSCYELDFWGDPEAFRPERFITDGRKLDQTKTSHVMTFNLGRRRCVGKAFARLQVFVVFSTLMQRCQFVNPRDVVYDLDPVPGQVYSPKDFLVIVKER